MMNWSAIHLPARLVPRISRCHRSCGSRYVLICGTCGRPTRSAAGRAGSASAPAGGAGHRPGPLLARPAAEQIGSATSTGRRGRMPVLRRPRGPGAGLLHHLRHDPAHPPSPHDRKLELDSDRRSGRTVRLDRGSSAGRPRRSSQTLRLGVQGDELPRHAHGSGVDTLIVIGVSTSHCVYATCRDATDSFRVIVPREAVGERCELMHEVFLLDIDIDLGDVTALADVVRYLESCTTRK